MSGRALKNHQAKEETMKLNRKAMVLAVGAALAAPGAYAQVTSKAGSDWEFYGKFYPEISRVHGENPTPTTTTGLSELAGTRTGRSNLVNRMEMLVSNSYIGFRGSKSISGGMKAIWQLESDLPIDEGGGTMAGRDTFAGIQGNWGTLRLGNMDTPFKKAGDVLGFLGVSSGNFVSTNAVLRKVGFGTSNAARFHERRANAIDFASPTFFGGLTYGVQYSIGNPTETAITSDPPRSPRFVSMALKWESGPLYVAVMHETHFDMFGGSANAPTARQNTADPSVNSKDTASQVAVVYKIGGHSLEADYIVKNYKENAGNSGVTGRFETYKNNAWMAVWEARWSSQWRTAAHYVSAGAGTCTLFNATCSTKGLEGKQMSVGVSYYLDPSVYLFGLYSVMKNGDGARYDNVSLGSPAVGEDVTQYAIGLNYSF
jgi:predicted porin